MFSHAIFLLANIFFLLYSLQYLTGQETNVDWTNIGSGGTNVDKNNFNRGTKISRWGLTPTLPTRSGIGPTVPL